MKIAIFRNIQYDFESTLGETMEGDDDYIRLTEYVDIEFVRLDNSDVAAREIAILNGVKKNIQAQAELKLGEIDRRIGDLLALPQAPASA